MNKITNYLTIDVEEHFQVAAFEDIITPNTWSDHGSRVVKNTRLILELLKKYHTKATFFIVGWTAERAPELVREIMHHGHEIGCHSYLHRKIYDLTPEEFRKDTIKAKDILEQITGKSIAGYRAPSYSITKKSLWALNILKELGFEYDSSIFPILHDNYGIPDAPRYPFQWDLSENHPQYPKLTNQRVQDVELSGNTPQTENYCPRSNMTPEISKNNIPLFPNQQTNITNQLTKKPINQSTALKEYPISTAKLLGRNIPIAGGGYFRLFPYWFTKMLLNKINQQENQPFIFYLHPWEVDPDQPRIKNAKLLSKFRHYNNLNKTVQRLERLLTDFKFGPVPVHLENF